MVNKSLIFQFLFLTFGSIQVCKTQNLVSNGCFEQCYSSKGSYYCEGWTPQNTIFFSYNNLKIINFHNSLPLVYHNSLCYPKQGSGCTLVTFLNNKGNQYFIQNKLIGTLAPNEVYMVRFFVKPLNLSSNYATWNIGARLSDTNLFEDFKQADNIEYDDFYYSHYINTVYPRRIIAHVANDSGNFITNERGWTEICGFYKAKGGEKYLMIGAFFINNENFIREIEEIIEYKQVSASEEMKFIIDSLLYGSHKYSSDGDMYQNAAFYFVDDVSVTKIDKEMDFVKTPRKDLLFPTFKNVPPKYFFVFQDDTNCINPSYKGLLEEFVDTLKKTDKKVIVYKTMTNNMLGEEKRRLERQRKEELYNLFFENGLDTARIIDFFDFSRGKGYTTTWNLLEKGNYLHMRFLEEKVLKLDAKYNPEQNCPCTREKYERVLKEDYP